MDNFTARKIYYFFTPAAHEAQASLDNRYPIQGNP